MYSPISSLFAPPLITLLVGLEPEKWVINQDIYVFFVTALLVKYCGAGIILLSSFYYVIYCTVEVDGMVVINWKEYG